MSRGQVTYLAAVVAVEALELGAEDGPVVELRVALNAEEDLLGAAGV